MRPRALVTGAAKRVGRAIALELARTGFDVAVHYRSSRAEADSVVSLAVAEGSDAWAVQADLASVEGCRSLIATVCARWDTLHLLVNNASIFHPVPFEDIDLAEWDRMMGVNLRAPLLLSQGLLPCLRAADGAALGAPDGQHGVVVHLCDIGAKRPVRRHAHYSVSKAGLLMLVRAMAVDLAPEVRTVGVSPGQVAWPESYDETKRERLAARIPMGRAGNPDDIATLVRFLATEGHYLNGLTVPVDGGLSVRY